MESIFQEVIDEFFEAESGLAVNGPTYLTEENNAVSEQTFLVTVVLQSISPGQGIQPATLNDDYGLSGTTPYVAHFLPTEQRITIGFTLFPDNVHEGTEAFLATSAPEDGGGFSVPRYLNPIALFAETLIVIEDDDCRFACTCLF